MFDNLTSEKLHYYVYALINPINNKPFYIGKGKGNRVFAHKEDVLNRNTQNSLKEDEIISILESGLDIKHIIIRHGLKENESFLLESTLIDFANYFDKKLTPLKQFILPGGSRGAAMLHITRSVSRRSERFAVKLSKINVINKNKIICLTMV